MNKVQDDEEKILSHVIGGGGNGLDVCGGGWTISGKILCKRVFE